MKYIPRFLESVILDSSRTFKVVYLGGPRQVGKTTVLKKLAGNKKFSYVTLDDLNQRELARTDPALFLQQLPRPAIIDEVQYAPELFPQIKKIVDRSDKNGQFWLTGSQQFSLIKNIQESLTGRVAVLSLLGLSRAEKNLDPRVKKHPFGGKYRKPNLLALFKEIFAGGLPVFQSNQPPNREIYFNSYIQTYLDRDLVGIFGVNKTSEFNRFIRVCAARTGQVLNTVDLARDSGVSPVTALEWLGILENTQQIYLLQPYFPNITKRIIKSPKLYFLDTGLAAYLSQWGTAAAAQSGAMAGAFFETFAISELIKSYLFRGKWPAFYYLRDKEGHEVDLVIEDNGLNLVEIKLSALARQSDALGMNYYSKKSDKFVSKKIVSLIEEPIVVQNQIGYLPYTVIA